MTDAYQNFVVVVDDLEWTKHWLEDLRCDRLVVSIAREGQTSPRIRIRAVESKAISAVTADEPGPATYPFDKGVNQVVATLDSLWSLIAPTAVDPLVEDLRFSSFIEQVAAVALSDLYPVRAGDAASLNVLRTISEFSTRQVPIEEIVLEGVVVSTQYRAAVPLRSVSYTAEGKNRAWPVFLVRAGSMELDTVMGPELADLIVKPLQTAAEPPRPSGPRVDGGEEPEPVEPEVASPQGEAAGDQPEWVQLADDLYLASQHRSFPLEQPDVANIVVGPALISVPMQLKAGASIRPIETALDDLAREVGVISVSVENDPDRPYHVRFLLARRDREFPELPADLPAPIDLATQSYHGLLLGRTLQGRDFASFASSWPHMLVAGTTGSGKTTFIRALLRQFAARDPLLVKIAIVDGKGDIDYLNVLPAQHYPPQFPDVVLGHQRAIEVLDWVVEQEMPARRARVIGIAQSRPGERPRAAREMFVESAAEGGAEPFPPLIIVIDEFAEIMRSGTATAQRFEQRVQQVAQVGRSGLVHLILATQRPDASVVSGSIKANLDSRVALRLPTHHDSMTVLGGKGAERLLGRGDLIFQSAGEPAVRLQGYNA